MRLNRTIVTAMSAEIADYSRVGAARKKTKAGKFVVGSKLRKKRTVKKMMVDEAIKIYEMGAKRTWNGRLTIYAEQCQQMAEWLKDYKRLLEQEPCEDAVSRQAVLEAIDVKAWEFCDYLIRNGRNDEQKPVSHFADNLRECVGDLPSVTPQPKMGSSSENPNKWIPVSKRLPEEAGMYLCSYDDDDVGTSYFDIRMNEFNMLHEQVTAWMELPPSYQGE